MSFFPFFIFLPIPEEKREDETPSRRKLTSSSERLAPRRSFEPLGRSFQPPAEEGGKK
jgi:hypothetical protein